MDEQFIYLNKESEDLLNLGTMIKTNTGKNAGQFHNLPMWFKKIIGSKYAVCEHKDLPDDIKKFVIEEAKQVMKDTMLLLSGKQIALTQKDLLLHAFEAGQDNANQTTEATFVKPTEEAFKDFLDEIEHVQVITYII